MNLTRRYKLYKLGICPDDKDSKLFKFVESKILNLQKFELSRYPRFVFYMNSDNQCIFEYDIKDKTLSVRYSGFWEVLEDVYMLTDFMDFIKSMVLEIYKMKVDTTSLLIFDDIALVEEVYKMKKQKV